MTYLITGATGFIGRALADRLLLRGHSVAYLSRRRSAQLDTRAAFFHWHDPVASLPPLETVPRIDGIIHLAGEPVAQRWSPAAKERIRTSRTMATRNLVEAIGRLKHVPKVMIAASATGYYGNRGDEALTEQSPAGAGFLADLCTEWEQTAGLARQFGVNVVHVRIGVVLGPGGALQKMLPAFQWGVGGRLGSGRQWMSWIHRDDLLRLFEFALAGGTPNTLNGTAPQPVTNAEFTRALARALGRPAIFPVPGFALEALFGEMAQMLLASAKVLPAAPQAAGFSFDYNTLDAALRQVLKAVR